MSSQPVAKPRSASRITHALSDPRSQVDDGAVAGKIAEGLLNTTSVRVFLHQNPEQIRRLLADLGLGSAHQGRP